MERWQKCRRSTSRNSVHLTVGRQPTHTAQDNRNCSIEWPSGNQTAPSAAVALLFLASLIYTKIHVRQMIFQLRRKRK